MHQVGEMDRSVSRILNVYQLPFSYASVRFCDHGIDGSLPVCVQGTRDGPQKPREVESVLWKLRARSFFSAPLAPTRKISQATGFMHRIRRYPAIYR